MSINTPTHRSRGNRGFRGNVPDYARPMSSSIYGSGGVYGSRPDIRGAPYYKWQGSNVPPARGRLPSPFPTPRSGRILTPKGLAAAALQAAITGTWRDGEPVARHNPGNKYSRTDTGTGWTLKPGAFNIGTQTFTNSVMSTTTSSSQWVNGTFRPYVTSANFWVFTDWIIPGAPNTRRFTKPFLWLGRYDKAPVRTIAPTPYPAAAPAQLPRFYPRDEASPQPQPKWARQPPRIQAGVGFDIPPVGPPRSVRVDPARPPRNVREVKVRGSASAAVSLVAEVLDTATEVADALAIFWEHLHPRPGENFYDTMLRYMINQELWAEVDWDAMVADMIMNHVEDAVVGRIEGLKRKLLTEWGTPTYGGAFQGP